MSTKASQEVLAISEAMYLAGRTGLTPDQITQQTKLPLETVTRRLVAAGPDCPVREDRRFNFDRMSGRWTLTLGGEQVLKQSGRATTRKGSRRLP